MSQQRWFEYKDDDLTIRLDNWKMGVEKAGLYAGFDFVQTDDTTLTLDHSKTGIIYNNVNNVAGNERSTVISNIGVIVKEDEEKTFPWNPNASSNPRIDLVYMQHLYKDGVEGGQQATYNLSEGVAASSPVAPGLPQAKDQVIIGYLHVPANTALLNSTVLWERAKCPFVRDKEWRNQKGSGISLSIQGLSGSEVLLDPRDFQFAELTLATTNLGGSHKIIIQDFIDPESAFGYELEFKALLPQDLSQINSDFTLDFCVKKGDTITTFFTLDKWVFPDEIGYIQLKHQGSVKGWQLNKYTAKLENINSRGTKKHEIQWAPRLVALESGVDAVMTGGNILTDLNPVIKAYYVIDESLISGLDFSNADIKPGTIVRIEARHNDGLEITNNQAGGPGATFSNIVFGDPIDFYTSTGTQGNNNIKVRKGGVITLIKTARGPWTIDNNSFTNIVRSLDNIVQAQIDKLVGISKFHVGSRTPVNLVGYSGEGPSEQGILIPDSILNTPNDGVLRTFFVWGKAVVNRHDSSAATPVSARLFLFSNGIQLDYGAHEDTVNIAGLGHSDDTITVMAFFQGNAQFQITMNAYTKSASFTFESIKLNIMGIPNTLFG